MTTKEKILNAALTLFSEQGVASTSLSHIASAVGIKKPSIYNHFACKDDLIEALYDENRKRLMTESSDEAFIRSLFVKDTLEGLKALIEKKQVYKEEASGQFWKMLFAEQFHSKKSWAMLLNEEKVQMQGTEKLIRYLIKEDKLIEMGEEDISALAQSYAYLGHTYHQHMILEESHNEKGQSPIALEGIIRILFTPYVRRS